MTFAELLDGSAAPAGSPGSNYPTAPSHGSGSTFKAVLETGVLPCPRATTQGYQQGHVPAGRARSWR